ncbi:hypothetical protein MKY37_04860 [Psychrobacillus sp. FSL K6-2836]|uniref:hypothetical protein n=1 Tax=Psychrobacillus sp. FSL K6-2836 TaxID=2921548 RepID=UPI0030F6F69A
MNKDREEQRRFLNEQIQWCKEQDQILKEIEARLYIMTDLVEYALIYDLNPNEITRVNFQLNELKKEVRSFNKQLYTILN